MPYMKKTPPDHAAGHMAGRSSLRIKNALKSKKILFFLDFFLISITESINQRMFCGQETRIKADLLGL